MINFDTIDAEILEQPKPYEIAVVEHNELLSEKIDLEPFIHASENFVAVCEHSAKTCLSMSLQARKIRNSIEKRRCEILRPHLDFQKKINKEAKEYEKKLIEVEECLSNKILQWLENPGENEIIQLSVSDGTFHKKEKFSFKIIDENLIPREYLKIDEKKIQDDIKKGVLDIAGISIFSENEIDLRVRN